MKSQELATTTSEVTLKPQVCVIKFDCLFCDRKQFFEVHVKPGEEISLTALSARAKKMGWVSGICSVTKRHNLWCPSCVRRANQ